MINADNENEHVTIDPRIQRTKEAIRTALVELIHEHGFDDLTIRDITARAAINRGTFYLHYKDKYDLLVQTEKAVIDDFNAIAAQAAAAQPVGLASMREPPSILVTIFEYLRDHAVLMQVLLGLKGDIGFQVVIRRVLEENLFRPAFFASSNLADLGVPADYMIDYVVSAILGVIRAWLHKGCLESPAEMARILLQLTFSGPLYALGSRAA